MILSATISSHPVFDELEKALADVVETLGEKWGDGLFTVESIRSPARSESERVFQIEGPDGVVLHIRFGVYPLGDGTYEIYADLDRGATCRCTYNTRGGQAEAAHERARLRRSVTAALDREIESRLDCAMRSGSSTGEARDTPSPLLVLDRDGAIIRMNEPARTVLECDEDDPGSPNFLSHVHGQNLGQVFRDLARMVQQELQRAQWLLRLETGSARWRWYRAEVLNRLAADGTIRVHLRGLETGSPNR